MLTPSLSLPWQPSKPLLERLQWLKDQKIQKITLHSTDPEMLFVQRFFQAQKCSENFTIKRVLYCYQKQTVELFTRMHETLKPYFSPRQQPAPELECWRKSAQLFMYRCGRGILPLWRMSGLYFTDNIGLAMRYNTGGPLQLAWVSMREPRLITEEVDLDTFSLPRSPRVYNVYNTNAVRLEKNDVFILSDAAQVLSTFQVELEQRDTTEDSVEDEDMPAQVADFHDFEALLVAVRASTFFSEEIAEHIVRYAIDPDRAFFKAIKYRDIESVKQFLQYRQFVETRHPDPRHHGMTALQYAFAIEGDREMAILLMSKHANIFATDFRDANLLHIALKNRNAPAAMFCLLHFPGMSLGRMRDGTTPLHCAVEWGVVDYCQRILSGGASPSAVNNRGWNALHTAIDYGHVDVVKCLLYEYPDLLHERTLNGYTPLHWAMKWGSSFTVCNAMLEYGADPSAVDIRGWNVVHVAAAAGRTLHMAPLLKRFPELFQSKTHAFTAFRPPTSKPPAKR